MLGALQARAEFVDPVPQQVRFSPSQLMAQFAQPFDPEETLRLHSGQDAACRTSNVARGLLTWFAYGQTWSTATTDGKWVKTTTDGPGRTVTVEGGHGSATVPVVETGYGPCA